MVAERDLGGIDRVFERACIPTYITRADDDLEASIIGAYGDHLGISEIVPANSDGGPVSGSFNASHCWPLRYLGFGGCTECGVVIVQMDIGSA